MSVRDRSALEAERDFLLDSIRRLDADQQAGILGDQEYQGLRDEQTIRAAAVLNQLDVYEPESAPKPITAAVIRRRMQLAIPRKRMMWSAAVVAFGFLTLALLSAAASGRLAGENSTGSINADSNTLLARAAQQSGKGNVADAVKTYDQVLKQDPANVQALTYRGWLIRLAGLSTQGLVSINQALAINAQYPDAHFFKGFILFRDQNDPKDAVTEFNSFLADNPPTDMVPLVQSTLQDAKAEAATQK